MNVFKGLEKMTIARRLMSGFFAITLIVVVLGALGIGFLAWLQTWRPDFVDSRDRVTLATQISDNVSTMQVAASALSAIQSAGSSGTLQEMFTSNNDSAVKNINSALAAKGLGSADAAELQQLKTTLGQFYQAGSKMFSSALAGSDETATLSARLTQLVSNYKQSAQAENSAQLDQLGSVGKAILIAMIILVVIGIIMSNVLGIAIARSITSGLRHTIDSIRRAASELLAVSSHVAASSAQTAASTNETTVTVEEVKQTAIVAHEKAAEVADSSEEVAQEYGGCHDRRYRTDAG
jgi:sensor histidine kinase YesM